jgi:BlaI family penicillinase repressor
LTTAKIHALYIAYVIIIAYAMKIAIEIRWYGSLWMKNGLSKREREILEIAYEKGRVSANEVQARLSGNVGNSAVRTMLGNLEKKGLMTHDHDGKRYVYHPTRNTREAGREALKAVVRTFFGNSAREAIAALIDDRGTTLADEDIRRLSELIERAKREGN